MKLKDSDLNIEQFAKFVSELKPAGYDSDIENFEEGTVYLNDTDYIEPDYVVLENEVDDEGKYQNLQSVYQYKDKNGDSIYLSHTCVRSGSYFSEYHYQDYELNVVTPHEKVVIEYY